MFGLFRKFPKDWNKTIEDLISEDREVTGEEFDWARNYERSLLDKDTRFPKNGEIYELKIEKVVKYLTHWAAPFTDGGECMLKAGTRIKVHVYKDRKPLGVYADPLEYEEIEKIIIPESDRNSQKYSGYSLHITTEMLNKDFSLVRIES